MYCNVVEQRQVTALVSEDSMLGGTPRCTMTWQNRGKCQLSLVNVSGTPHSVHCDMVEQREVTALVSEDSTEVHTPGELWRGLYHDGVEQREVSAPVGEDSLNQAVLL